MLFELVLKLISFKSVTCHQQIIYKNKEANYLGKQRIHCEKLDGYIFCIANTILLISFIVK